VDPAPLNVRDLRLSPDRALDPKGHFTEQKHISEILPDQIFRVDDTTATKVHIYDLHTC
jgi:hypothetical protein